MDKLNVLTLGGCAPYDIITANRNHTTLYNIDMWLGSFSRQLWEPGKVALRLKEELDSILESVRTAPEDKADVLMQLSYTIKEWRTPTTLIQNLPPNSVVILDPAYEIQSFYFDGNEIFDIHLNYDITVRKHMPAWFNQLVNKHVHQYDCGIMEIAMFQTHAIRKFAKELAKQNVPVIAVNNLYTRKIYDPITNGAVLAIKQYNNKMPFSKQHSNELEKYEYSNELIERFYEIWTDFLPKKFKRFTPSIDGLYADVNHHIGYHPTHLHHTCRTALNAELNAMIVETVAEHKAQQPLILPGDPEFNRTS